jgi:hypothetical protein
MTRTKQIVRIFKRINSFLESSTNMQLKIKKFNLYLYYGDNNRFVKQLTYHGLSYDRLSLTDSLLNVLLQNSIAFSLFDHFKDPKMIYYTFFKLSSNERAILNRSKFAKVAKYLSSAYSLDELEIKMDLLGV